MTRKSKGQRSKGKNKCKIQNKNQKLSIIVFHKFFILNFIFGSCFSARGLIRPLADAL